MDSEMTWDILKFPNCESPDSSQVIAGCQDPKKRLIKEV